MKHIKHLSFCILFFTPLFCFSLTERGMFIAEVESCKFNNLSVKTGDTLRLKDNSEIYVFKLGKYSRHGLEIYYANVKKGNRKAVYCLNDAVLAGEIIVPGGVYVNSKYYYKYPILVEDTLFVNDSAQVSPGQYVMLNRGSLPNGNYKWINVEKGKGNYYSGKKYLVHKVKLSGDKRHGFRAFIFLDGEHKRYSCDGENAYLAGEISFNGISYKAETKNGYSVADELVKLKKLRNNGTITEDEFQAQKKKLLAQ